MQLTVPIASINPDEPLSVRIDDTHSITVCVLEGRYHALQGECPHRGAKLYDGDIIDNVIVCPLHHFKFNIETGRCLMPKHLVAKKFPVTQEGDQLVIQVEGAPEDG